MLRFRWFSLATVCLLMSWIQLVSGGSIMVLMAFSSKSHKAVFMPMINELNKRGHEITIVSPHASNENARTPGVRDIAAPKAVEVFKNVKMPFGGKRMTVFQFWDKLVPMISTICDITFNNPEFQDFLRDKSKIYDLAIIDALFNECMLPVVHHFQVPFVYLSTSAPPTWVLEAIGAPNAFSYVPEFQGTYTSQMSFRERSSNLWESLLNMYYRKYVLMPAWNTFARKVLPGTPDLREIDRNVSFLFTNTHPSITYQFPLNPAIAEVGAMHCKPAKPLSKDLEDFVDGSGEHGFIIVSFGSILRGVDMPLHVRRMFVKAFSRIPQRVVWKWETDEEIEGLSDNVRLSQWLPQQDLLGHRKIKAFVTHGGLLSTQESVYHGCPLIGLPISGDQAVNLAKADKDGYAVHLSWDDITEEKMYQAIHAVTNDASYSSKVKHLSRLLRDQPETAVERAVYWVEYMIRHKGAPHLRSPALELADYQIYLVDIIVLVLAAIHVLLAILLFLVWKLRKMVLISRSQSKQNFSRKKKS